MRPFRPGAAGWALVALTALPHTSAAQAALQETPDFNRLKTPESPAFAILGTVPSEVQRPTSPRGFAVSFLDALQGQRESSLIPSSFAVEVNPFWWSSHPEITFEEYEKGGLPSLWRTLTVSMATTDQPLPVPGDEPGASFRRIGIGLRSTVFGTQDREPCVDRILDVASTLSDAVAGGVALAIVQDPGLAERAADLEALREELFEGARAGLSREDQATLQSVESCTDEIADRTGFVMGIAAAGALGFLPPGDPGSPVPEPTSELNTFGLWITPSYLMGSFSGVTLLRARWNELGAEDAAFALDLGGRAIYSSGRFAASAEGVYRRRDLEGETREEWRAAVVLDVRVSDDLWLTSTFGRDFEPGASGSLIALANLQWAFGKPPPRPIPGF